jgi:STAS domain
VSILEISVTAGPDGPVVVLSGVADVTTAGQLGKTLAAQVSVGAPHLAVDLSGLRFADSAAIQALVQAHPALMDPGRGAGAGAPAAGRGQGAQPAGRGPGAQGARRAGAEGT